MDWAREGMAKTDSAKNKKMSFFIGLSPFGLLRAFRLEPKAKMQGAVRWARLILERFSQARGGETAAECSITATGTPKTEGEKVWRLDGQGTGRDVRGRALAHHLATAPPDGKEF